ncbi:MAG: fibronectin type III domain-containing protein [Solirubrobacteraceae bacterium]|nr:fibronectin type III domain-containing protein [Solirubrobacteraceae bacterium]
MSLSSSARRALLASATAVAAFGLASSAQAASTTLTYQCKYPILGTEPLSVAFNLDLPDSWQPGLPTPPFAISAVASAGGDTTSGLQLIEGLASLEGVALASTSVELPEGGSLKVKVPMKVEKLSLQVPFPDPLVLSAAGESPSLTFEEFGRARFLLDQLQFNLTARDAAGDPIILPPPTRVIGGQPLPPEVTYADADPETFDVFCKLDAGQAPPLESPVLATLDILSCSCGDQPPSTPGLIALRPGDVAQTSVNLRWQPSTDDRGIARYEIRWDGGQRTVDAPGTAALIDGLAPDTDYRFEIRAIDTAGQSSPPLQVSATTDRINSPLPVKYSYGLAGSASLKTLTKGNLPLKGSIDAELTLATGAFSADLALADTQGRLTALGFLPVTAKIGFVPSGKTTGTLLDGVLSSNSKVRIKVKEVKLFGAIPLAGGNTCQTKSLSDIALTSTDEFKPLQGGTLAGTFAISDLNGCGALNGLVSPLTAGGGNTITLKLTPKPTA